MSEQYEDIIDRHGNNVPYHIYIDQVGRKEAKKDLLFQRKMQGKDPELANVKKQSYEINGQFVPVTFKRLDDYTFRVKHRSEILLYLYLRRFIARRHSKNDIYNIYDRYYMDNKLACTMSVRRLAKDFGYKDKSQIIKWLKSLHADGAFIKDEIDVGQPKKQIVYILGEVRGYKAFYYYDSNLLESPKEPTQEF